MLSEIFSPFVIACFAIAAFAGIITLIANHAGKKANHCGPQAPQRTGPVADFNRADAAYTYERVKVYVQSWGLYGMDTIGSGDRVYAVQEPSNSYDPYAVLLPFADASIYLYRGDIQDMANTFLNRGDIVIAEATYMDKENNRLYVTLYMLRNK